MAAVRSKLPVGSAPWIVSERKQADELVEQEAEEFGYSVRNEMEWLNEHMAEIFSSTQLYVRLRRTTRYANGMQGRDKRFQDSGQAKGKDSSNGTNAKCTWNTNRMFFASDSGNRVTDDNNSH